MNTDTDKFMTGAMAGVAVVVVGLMVLTASGVGALAEYKQSIAECEETLPRNQRCHIIAVPTDVVSD